MLKRPGFWLGLFFINLFMFVLNFVGFLEYGHPVHLPILCLGSAVLCLVGYQQNIDRGE